MVGATFTVAAAAEVLRSKKGIIAVSPAQISTAQSKFGGASALFDGTNTSKLVSDSFTSPLGTDNFTIEFWFRPVAGGGGNYGRLMQFGSNDAGFLTISKDTNNPMKILLVIFTSTFVIPITSTNSFANDTWHHCALVRSSGNFTLYVNGASEGTSTDYTSYNINKTQFFVGGNNSNEDFQGYIDEFRISNTARYTTTFTPSTTPFVNDANTLFLMHANGTNASTFFEDDNGTGRSPVGMYGNGNAQVDTAQSKFGGASLLLDGTGDFLELTGVNISRSDNFTCEAWIRLAALPGTNSFSMLLSGVGGGEQYMSIKNISGTYVSDIVVNNGSTLREEDYTISSISTNTWYHWAIVKNGSTLTHYFNGTALTTLLSSQGTMTSGHGFNAINKIGVYSNNSLGWNGHLDEIRVSNSARYTANFTPSTTPFVNDANTLLLIHADGTDASTVFLDDNGQSRSPKGISANGNAQVDIAQSKFGGSAALFDGTGDYLRLGSAGDLAFGSNNWTVEGWIRPTNNLSGYKVVYNHNDNGTDRSWFTIQLENATLKSWGTTSTGSWNVYSDLSFGSLSIDTWNHFALVRDGSTMRAFLNGTQINTASCTGWTIPAQTAGATLSAVPASYFFGWMDEVRISNTARYTAGFTPSTTPFQNDANTLLLLHMDGTDASTAFFDDNGIAPYTP
jgi:hypothetical protein